MLLCTYRERSCGRAWEERRKERKKGRMKMMWGKERIKKGGSVGRERGVKSREKSADKKGRMEGREGKIETERTREKEDPGTNAIYSALPQTPTGCCSTKAITSALLAMLEIKFGPLKFYKARGSGGR